MKIIIINIQLRKASFFYYFHFVKSRNKLLVTNWSRKQLNIEYKVKNEKTVERESKTDRKPLH